MVTGISEDSRKIKKGNIFVAYKGAKTDGTLFVKNAVEKGAVAVLAKEKIPLPPGIIFLKHDNPRLALSLLAKRFYPKEPEHILAVTGTNGKTSVAHFIREILARIKGNAASIGTLGVIGNNSEAIIETPYSMTTPDPVFLYQTIQELSERGIRHLSIEASSHGLDQYRLDAIKIEAAGFTNLTRDHLDYHESMEAYLNAKLRLFKDIVSKDGVSVINADIPQYEMIKDASRAKVLSYGSSGKDFTMMSQKPTLFGQDIDIRIKNKKFRISLPLVGAFQSGNILCALGMVIGRELVNLDEALKVLPNISSVPGRMQKAVEHPEGGGVYVDYAHTPDALEKALMALKAHTTGRIIVVFGCGGNRDKGKRPQMGKIASGLADIVIVTDDNPRNEDPSMIRREIIMSTPNAHEIGNRSEAIHQALTLMHGGDIVLLAGKGHEKSQVIGDMSYPFDDVEEAKKSAVEIWGK